MWTREISSGSTEHPGPKDVFRTLLSRLSDHGGDAVWAHFEIRVEGGWFADLVSSQQPWIEVAFMKERGLQVNPGIPRQDLDKIPPVPNGWWQDREQLWNVPAGHSEELIEWMDKYLASVCGKSGYRVKGWIEGL